MLYTLWIRSMLPTDAEHFPPDCHHHEGPPWCFASNYVRAHFIRTSSGDSALDSRTARRSSLRAMLLVHLPSYTEIALGHLSFRRLFLQRITTFQPLLRFLRTYLRVDKTVVSLRLCGAIEIDRKYCTRPTTTIDDTTVASILELLPQLDSLFLDNFRFVTPTSPNPENSTTGPFPLSTLAIWGLTFDHEQTSLTGALRVLSLCTVVRLERFEVGEFDTGETFDTRHLHRPLDVQRISVLRTSPKGPRYTLLKIRGVAVSFKCDSLQELFIRLDFGEAALALGGLLARAGRNITALAIDTPLGIAPRQRMDFARQLAEAQHIGVQ
ncbi:hypothetical protein C8T65DRAFT_272799 [Cerioporus squamosus]|nr:hypothetical protein C8T65DRAFT_272799 [Cerioporus squamosus]